MTGRPGLEGRSRAEGIGHHFAKPIDPGVLAELLRRIAAGG